MKINIEFDKILHFFAGVLLVSFYAALFPSISNYCIVFAILGGLAKELYDEYDYNGFCWKDWLATTLGGLAMQILLYIF